MSGVEMNDRDFRLMARSLPTTVTVVSGTVNGAPLGMVVGSFVPISSNPALVGFFGDRRSNTFTSIVDMTRLSFCVLADNQHEVVEKFRGPASNRFDGVDWYPSARGLPRIRGSFVSLDAEVHSRAELGDHIMVVARVLDSEVGGPDDAPILYHRFQLTTPRAATSA